MSEGLDDDFSTIEIFNTLPSCTVDKSNEVRVEDGAQQTQIA